MTFLNPFVLLGLVAAGIPLIIHLFNFRRPRRVDFSSLAFVRELQKSTMQRVRLKQWLLLLLRTLAIAMLVLAFARPTLTGGLASMLGGPGRSSVVLVVDNSASMELRDAQGAYLDQARSLARAVAGQMEQGDEIFVLTTAGRRVPPVAHQTAASLEAGIDAIEVGTPAVPARAVLNDAAELLAESQNVNREIYFIGDLQRRTLGDSVAMELDPQLSLVVLPVGTRGHTNVMIEDVRVESRIVEAGSPVGLTARVRSFGQEAISDYSISVYLGDERVAQAPVDLQPGISSEVSLVVTPQENGWLAGRVEGEDDAFPQDNVHFFTMHVPAQRRILLVTGSDAVTRYLELALSTRQTAGGASFDVERIAATSLPNVLARLGQYDAVILAGSAATSSGEIDALVRYVSNGGGLLMMPGQVGEVARLNPLLQALGGGRVTGVVGEPGRSQAVATFERVDAEHPVFEGVFERTAGTGETAVESPRVNAAIHYEPGAGSEQSLIRLTNGSSFLQELRLGQGLVFLLAVAPVPSWSDLPVRGLFVPLTYRSIQYLSASETIQGEGMRVGAEREIRLAGFSGRERVRIVSPFGEETLPDQRVIPGAVLVRLSEGHNVAGIYDLYAGETLVRRLAANVDRAESDLETVAPDEFESRLESETDATVQVLQLGEDALDASDSIRARRSGVELWNVFLLLALAFLVSEMIVARQWRPEAVAS